MLWVRIPLGAFDFSGICSVYIDRHIRVDLSDDEQFVRNMPCYILLCIILESLCKAKNPILAEFISVAVVLSNTGICTLPWRTCSITLSLKFAILSIVHIYTLSWREAL